MGAAGWPILASGYSSGWASRFGAGWETTQRNKLLVFNVTGKNIGMVYKRSGDANGGRIQIKVDNGTPMYLDSYFVNGCGSPNSFEIAKDLTDTTHRVEIFMTDTFTSTTGNYFAICGLLVGH